MPTYKRFEDLPVWQDAIRLAEKCDDFLDAAGSRISRGKRDQLDRASLSVSNNIAEGFERGTTAELLSFLYIARGSAGEVRSMGCFFERRPALAELKFQITNLKSLAESCSRQIRAWTAQLQNSPIEGQRRLNDATRAQWERQQDRDNRYQQFLDLQRRHLAHLPKDHHLRAAFEKKHGPIPE